MYLYLADKYVDLFPLHTGGKRGVNWIAVTELESSRAMVIAQADRTGGSFQTLNPNIAGTDVMRAPSSTSITASPSWSGRNPRAWSSRAVTPPRASNTASLHRKASFPAHSVGGHIEVPSNVEIVFERVDHNQDGKLTRAELIKALRQDEELQKLLQLPGRVGDSQRQVFERVFQGG